MNHCALFVCVLFLGAAVQGRPTVITPGTVQTGYISAPQQTRSVYTTGTVSQTAQTCTLANCNTAQCRSTDACVRYLYPQQAQTIQTVQAQPASYQLQTIQTQPASYQLQTVQTQPASYQMQSFPQNSYSIQTAPQNTYSYQPAQQNYYTVESVQAAPTVRRYVQTSSPQTVSVATTGVQYAQAPGYTYTTGQTGQRVGTVQSYLQSY